MLDLPRPEFPNHPRMPVADRAAIFNPFAALTGHVEIPLDSDRFPGYPGYLYEM